MIYTLTALPIEIRAGRLLQISTSRHGSSSKAGMHVLASYANSCNGVAQLLRADITHVLRVI